MWGEMTLADCAKRNGVATGSLDVGIDEAGNLAAADQAGALLTPLPPRPEPVTAAVAPPGAVVPAPAAPPQRARGQLLALRRRRVAQAAERTHAQRLRSDPVRRPLRTPGRSDLWPLDVPDPASAPGKVEVSGDNRSFRLLAEQAANCSIAPIG
jgi:hypothetical protein